MKTSIAYEIQYVDNEVKLKPVLELCYKILGQDSRDQENYTFDDWINRIDEWSKLLVYALTQIAFMKNVVIMKCMDRKSIKKSYSY